MASVSVGQQVLPRLVMTVLKHKLWRRGLLSKNRSFAREAPSFVSKRPLPNRQSLQQAWQAGVVRQTIIFIFAGAASSPHRGRSHEDASIDPPSLSAGGPCRKSASLCYSDLGRQSAEAPRHQVLCQLALAPKLPAKPPQSPSFLDCPQVPRPNWHRRRRACRCANC
jgi:hypothetical protein